MEQSGQLPTETIAQNFRKIIEVHNQQERPSIQPLGRRIALLTVHQALIGASPSGLYIPETASIGNRWFGLVVGVGQIFSKTVGKFIPCSKDLRFGDLVELSRWTGELWHRHPASWIFGKYGDAKVRVYDRNGQDSIEVDRTDQFSITDPEHIIYKIAYANWMFNQKGLGPGVYAIGDRVIVEEIPDEKTSQLEVIEYERKTPMRARVINCGLDVDSVIGGDVIRFGGSNQKIQGSEIYCSSGKKMFSIHERDILCLEESND